MMNSFLFYNLRNLHTRSELDLLIDYIDDLQRLDDATNIGNRVQQIVCVCSSDVQTVLNQIQHKPQIVSIYVCGNANHGAPVMNDSPGSKVHYGIIFEPDSGWEFDGRSALLEACIDGQCDAQFIQEIHQLRNITRTGMSIPPLSLAAINQ